jgi:dTDP-4-amino-4,6-dideoxygalactose transaminase
MKIPIVRPAPPQLSLAIAELKALEESGVFSNFGPVNTRFEEEMLERFFGGEGACMTVCNATIGLMLAIKDAVGEHPSGKFALMPSFTFAAAAHAALWCGLTPLLCDVDPATWAADSAAESQMLSRFAGQVAVVMPYSTFGYPIDLEPYTTLAAKLGVPTVVDGAASLGTFDSHGRGFGSGFAGSVVYSMHATKSFAVGEAGLIYSADTDLIARLRIMSSFGFGELPELQFQLKAPGTQAHQFVPALLPSRLKAERVALRAQLAEQGIATGSYFSPHLMEQPYFQKTCVAGPLPVADDVSARMISLPLFDTMTHAEVDYVSESLNTLMGVTAQDRMRPEPSRNEQPVQLVSA